MSPRTLINQIREAVPLVIDSFVDPQQRKINALAELAFDGVEGIIHMFNSNRAADRLWDETTRKGADKLATEEEEREVWEPGEKGHWPSNPDAQGVWPENPITIAEVAAQQDLGHIASNTDRIITILEDLYELFANSPQFSAAGSLTSSGPVAERPAPASPPASGRGATITSADGVAHQFDRADRGPAADAPDQELSPPGPGQPASRLEQLITAAVLQAALKKAMQKGETA